MQEKSDRANMFYTKIIDLYFFTESIFLRSTINKQFRYDKMKYMNEQQQK